MPNLIVQQLSSTVWSNRSLCDKSMKFGTLIAKGILKRFRDGDILNFQHGAHSSHFSKWLPATTVFLWVMDVIWYFWLICHTDIHRDVFCSIQHCHDYSRWLPFFKMAAIACMTDMGVKSVGLYFLWGKIQIWNIVIALLPPVFRYDYWNCNKYYNPYCDLFYCNLNVK